MDKVYINGKLVNNMMEAGKMASNTEHREGRYANLKNVSQIGIWDDGNRIKWIEL
jgi:hypothetical protein